MFMKLSPAMAALTVIGLTAGAAWAAPIHGSLPLKGMSENDHATASQKMAISRQLAPKATIDRKRAIAAAHTVTQGKVDKIMLENEDGYLVYAVFLNGHEVLVDAGNAKVLGDEKESVKEND